MWMWFGCLLSFCVGGLFGIFLMALAVSAKASYADEDRMKKLQDNSNGECRMKNE